MKKFFIISFLIILPCFLIASPEIDSLLNVLDRTIKLRSSFNEKKEQIIKELEKEVYSTSNPEQKYLLLEKLFKEYRHYNMESALKIAQDKYLISNSMQHKQYVIKSEMNIAEILAIVGMYKEGLEILDKINRNKLVNEEWALYYHRYHSIYYLLSENALSQTIKLHYEQLMSKYKDSMLISNKTNTMSYFYAKNGKLVEQGKYTEALQLMERCYQEYGKEETSIGTLAYTLAQNYALNKNFEQEKKHLLISAISDLRMAVKSYISLRKLATILYKEGDVNRAYSYIKCSMEDATFCKARFRTIEVAEMLPIITTAYDQKVKQEKINLLKYSSFISILTLILIACIIYIYKQLKKLSLAQKSIAQMYEEMKQMNFDLKELNIQLSESNTIKEAYIGSIFNLCSNYIYKMEAYRLNIYRNLKSGKIEELTQSAGLSIISEELKEFFGNFDAIFLNIYPNFLDDFNSLLKKEEQIIPKSGDILTPELRVFALIRLGINDNSKIASFLHYSPQTVYNYKLKIRNRLNVPKEEFSEAIQQIGK